MSPPRLTGALRSFSSVSKKEEQTEQLYDLKVRHDDYCVVEGSLKKQRMTTMTLLKRVLRQSCQVTIIIG